MKKIIYPKIKQYRDGLRFAHRLSHTKSTEEERMVTPCIPTHYISNSKTRNRDLTVASGLVCEKDLWTIKTNKNGKKPEVVYDFENILTYLAESGFHKYETGDNIDGKTLFLREVNGVLERTSPELIQDYFLNFVRQFTKNEVVLDYWTEYVYYILTDIKLRSLPQMEVDLKYYSDSSQMFFFRNSQVNVTARDIKSYLFIGPAWRDEIHNRTFTRVPIVSNIRNNGNYHFDVETTDNAINCHFFQFICNTSAMTKISEESSDEELWNYNQHIVNKMTSIGYLLARHNSFCERIAIVAEDFTLSTNMKATGGTGKSLIGSALDEMVPTTMIDGNRYRNNKSVFSHIDNQTRVILIEDAKPNFQFLNLHSVLTGRMQINRPHQKTVAIKAEDTPKIYITTNYRIKDDSDSTKRRINYMVFSPHYNKNYSPYDDFGVEFFRGWDDEQWNLFYNFMLECLMYYFRSIEDEWHESAGKGAIPPPIKSVRKKQIPTKIGPVFLDWAEGFFSPNGGFLNKRVNRVDMLDNLKKNYPSEKHITSRDFSTRIKAFCQLKGYDFNRHKPTKDKDNFYTWKARNPKQSYIGGRDTSGGKEFFIISDERYEGNCSH